MFGCPVNRTLRKFFFAAHKSQPLKKIHCITLCKWSWLTLVTSLFLACDSSIMTDNDPARKTVLQIPPATPQK